MWYIYIHIYIYIYIYYIILLYIHKHILDICVHVDHVGIWLLTTIQDRLGTFPDSRNNDGCLRGVLLIESLDRSMINLELAGRCCRVVQQRQRHVANVKSNSHMIQWYIMINQLKLTNFVPFSGQPSAVWRVLLEKMESKKSFMLSYSVIKDKMGKKHVHSAASKDKDGNIVRGCAKSMIQVKQWIPSMSGNTMENHGKRIFPPSTTTKSEEPAFKHVHRRRCRTF